MKCIIDTNVLIDFKCAGILDYPFRLNIEWVVTDLLVEELKDPEPATLQRMGLRVVELPSEAVAEVAQLSEDYPRLSVGDRSLLVLASYRGITLVTGDSRLRYAARERGVSVQGTLWVLDQLVAGGTLPSQEAARALRQMLARGRRLPRSECNNRLKQWESR